MKFSAFKYSLFTFFVICLLYKPAFSQTSGIGGTTGISQRKSIVTASLLPGSSTVGGIGIRKYARIEPVIPHDLPVPPDAPLPTDQFESFKIPGYKKVLSAPSPPTSVSFQGLDDNNTAIPPDVSGAAGPGHMMTTHNSQVKIQDKDGNQISKFSLDVFWASLGNPGAFDPRILFDPYNNRWIFVCTANPQDASSAILIGVSATSNPTGAWYLFSVDADNTNMTWADYPTVGFNKDWIAVQVNMFSMSNSFTKSKVYVFKKMDLYNNVDATHTLISLDGMGAVQFPATTYDNSLSTLYLLQDWNGNSGGSGYLRLYTITGAIGSEVITPVTFISTVNAWKEEAGGGDFAPQLGSSKKIQTNDARLGNVVYRNGSLWTSHTVFLPVASSTARSSVQWWQISTAGAILQRGRIDDPTNTNFYAFPSIAVNTNDDVLIGYSKFSASSYASAYYSYRSAGDAPNTMREDALLKEGESTYYKTFGGDENRWGDYSNTCVDPTNDFDLWTIQEYASSTSNKWATWWGRVASSAVPFSDGSAPEYRTDNGSVLINLDFTFTLFGDDYTQVYINNNGTLSFGSPIASGMPTDYPFASGVPSISPFWADVDTRAPESGIVYFVKNSSSLSVFWTNVGYNNQHSDKKNTFSVTITNGSDASIGVGKNVQFTYTNMEWSTGDAAGGSGGLGGTSATAGINKGDGTTFIKLGRFDGEAELDFLNGKQFTYDASSTSTIVSWQNRFNNTPQKKVEDMGFKIPTIAKKMAHNLAVDAQGNVYVTGYADQGSSGGKYDYLTIKYDAFGNKFWSVFYNNNSLGKDDKAYAITVDADGNSYVTGESDGGATKVDILTVKYDALGNEQWTKRYNNSLVNKRDAGYAIGLSPAGDVVYVAGETDNGSAKTDFVTIAYDAMNGNELWTQKYDGPSHKIDKAYTLVVDASNNVIVAGESDGGITKIDYAIVKYVGGAGGGAIVSGWPQRYNQANKKDYPFALTVDGAGNIYVAGGSEGSTKFDYATVKYDVNGGQQWASLYNGSANKNDIAYGIAVDGTGNVYVTGASEGLKNKNNYMTVKYNSTGDLQWGRAYSGIKDDIARAIAVCEGEGAVFVTGSSEQGSSKKSDYFSMRLSMVDGTPDWFGDYNGSASKIDIPYSLAIRQTTCELVITGTSDGGVNKLDFATIHGPSDVALPSINTLNLSEEKEDEKPATPYIVENYPNPFNPSTIIRYELPEASLVTLRVFDVLGQELAAEVIKERQNAGKHDVTFDGSGLSSGVYFYKLNVESLQSGNSIVLTGKMLLIR